MACGCQGNASTRTMTPEELAAQQAARQEEARLAREAYAASMQRAIANANSQTATTSA